MRIIDEGVCCVTCRLSELLLNHKISAAHQQRLTTSRSRSLSLCFPLCPLHTGAISVVVSLALTSMKWKIFWAGAALLCCLDKNLSREQREGHSFILLAAKRTASLLLLLLNAILCRPRQDTGDSTPESCSAWRKSSRRSNPLGWFCISEPKQQQQQKAACPKRNDQLYFTHPKPEHSPRQPSV